MDRIAYLDNQNSFEFQIELTIDLLPWAQPFMSVKLLI
jgi:hypothetical protein